MANTKKIVGAGGKTKKQLWIEKRKQYMRPSLQHETRAIRRPRGINKSTQGYVSSYLDLSADTPGKYGVDY